MKNSKVSETYFQACGRIHDAADMLYESLHEEEGEAVTEFNEVLKKMYSNNNYSPNYNTDEGYTLMKLSLIDLEFLLMTLL